MGLGEGEKKTRAEKQLVAKASEATWPSCMASLEAG